MCHRDPGERTCLSSLSHVGRFILPILVLGWGPSGKEDMAVIELLPWSWVEQPGAPWQGCGPGIWPWGLAESCLAFVCSGQSLPDKWIVRSIP